MSMERKSFRLEVKNLSEEGTFEGYLSTWEKDRGDDIIIPGAFKRTLEAWQKKGKPVPMLWDHWPSEPIGGFPELKEDQHGLLVKGSLALGVSRAREVYELMKMGVVSAMSIGYSVVQQEFTESVRVLKELRLWEGSLVLWPMNEGATVDSVKSLSGLLAELKSGRRLSPERERLLSETLTSLKALLEAAPAAEGTRQEQPGAPGDTHAPAAAKVDASWMEDVRKQLET